MTLKEFITDYLTFSRKERIAVLALLFIIALVFFLPVAISVKSHPHDEKIDSSWIGLMKNIEKKQGEKKSNFSPDNSSYDNNYQYDRSKYDYYGKPNAELFYFDPNTLSISGWQQLGIRDKTIQTIQNYLKKGGEFRKPEDLKKIYGLSPNEFKKIEPFIRISSITLPKNEETFEENSSSAFKKSNSSKFKIIDINIADSLAFIALPGIGEKLSGRILKFRDKLGGFYSIEQVGETYGLPDSTFQKIKKYLEIGTPTVKKININTATTEELKTHPYIKWTIANAIVAYRNQHGPFKKTEDIKKIMLVTNEVYDKVSPYLMTQK